MGSKYTNQSFFSEPISSFITLGMVRFDIPPSTSNGLCLSESGPGTFSAWRGRFVIPNGKMPILVLPSRDAPFVRFVSATIGKGPAYFGRGDV